MIIAEKTQLKGKAICICANNQVVCYKAGWLFCYDCNSYVCKRKIKLPLPLWKRLLCKIRLFERLLHIEARWGIEVEPGQVLVQFERLTLNVNIQSGDIAVEKIAPRGKPLECVKVENVSGFRNGYLLGDYGSNTERQEVHIYQRDAHAAQWKTAYTFKADAVRHIHGFSIDAEQGCIYIMTGDENAESGVWKATDDFATVEPILLGRQMYRACKMLPTKDGFYYLTDSPSDPNYLMRMERGAVVRMHTLSGTVIYGSRVMDGLMFSTTIEPDAHAKDKLHYWLTSKPGKGISEPFAGVFFMDCNGNMEKICAFSHDRLPLRLFQYASVSFTNYMNGRVFLSAACTKGTDRNIYTMSVKRMK